MKYEIKGGELPVVVCFMDAGETMITEKGSMSWMSPNMKMETTSNGGVGKALGRMFAGEAIFQNRYTAEGGPGNDDAIRAVKLIVSKMADAVIEANQGATDEEYYEAETAVEAEEAVEE